MLTQTEAANVLLYMLANDREEIVLHGRVFTLAAVESAANANRLDALAPRLAAVRSWFEYRELPYAIARLRACVEPSPAARAVLAAYAAVSGPADTHAVVAALWALRRELHEEGETNA